MSSLSDAMAFTERRIRLARSMAFGKALARRRLKAFAMHGEMIVGCSVL